MCRFPFKTFLLLSLPILFLAALTIFGDPLQKAAAWVRGDEWQVKKLSVESPTPLDQYFGATCVVNFDVELPRRRPNADQFQATVQVVDRETKKTHPLALWNSPPTRWDHSHFHFHQFSSRSVTGRISFAPNQNNSASDLTLKIAAFDATGGIEWNYSQPYAPEPKPAFSRQPNFQIWNVRQVEDSPPMWRISARKISSDHDETAQFVQFLTRPLGKTVGVDWHFTTPHLTEPPSTFAPAPDKSSILKNNWGYDIQMPSHLQKSKGELWLRARLSVDYGWPQDIDIFLRDEKGRWLAEPRVKIRPAPSLE